MLVSTKKIEIPNMCPKDCKFKYDIYNYGQSAICFRCPVLNCKLLDEIGYLIKPEDFRADWAESWAKFFKGDIEEPELLLNTEEQE